MAMTRDQLLQLMEAHQAELYRYVKYLGADHATAEDIVQDAFLAAFRARQQPDLDAARVRGAWLRRIARNRFLEHCRRARRSPVRFDSETAEQAEDYWANAFLAHDDGFGVFEALRECLEDLPERQRQFIDGFYRRRLSRIELGALLQVSEEGVKAALRRIRAALADCIDRRMAEA